MHHCDSNDSKGRMQITYDDIIIWKHFLYYWLFVRGIHQSLVDSPHKGPVAQSFVVFFDVCLNKQWSHQWFETMTIMWRHCSDELTNRPHTSPHTSSSWARYRESVVVLKKRWPWFTRHDCAMLKRLLYLFHSMHATRCFTLKAHLFLYSTLPGWRYPQHIKLQLRIW